LKTGEVADQAGIARRENITRARVTQILKLLNLASEIQKHILSMRETFQRPVITERSLRPITRLEDKEEQLSAFSAIITNHQLNHQPTS